MNVLLKRVIELFIYPPGNLFGFLFLALIFRHKAKLILSIGVLQLLLFSMPVVSERLMHSLESQYPAKADLWEQGSLPEAIVVLGGGRNLGAWEYGGESVSMTELERLRYAATLHRGTGLPILVTGGDPLGEGLSEAELMRDTLNKEFNVPVRWLEENSHTTAQNAEFSDQILAKAGIQSAWLVTHAWHMPRSLMAFDDLKVNYYPASHSFGVAVPFQDNGVEWIPQAKALMRTNVALHEWLGIAWYALSK